ncbi:MAG: hypothetical protein ACSHX9_16205 [Luteolibacter sp.]
MSEAVKAAFSVIGAEASFPLLDQLFSDVTGMFKGEYAGYQAIDMDYHNYEHTLQAAVCMIHLLHGRSLTADQPVLLARDWELSVMAVLLHDAGLLKEVGDDSGTGAKYTFVHEMRSCEFAKKYLPGLGVTASEIEDVCSAIICTGPRSKISEVTFQREESRHMAYLLVTADYLAQMSAADYLDKLPKLFLEFQEAFELAEIPLEDRPYQSLRELLEKSPGFWYSYVQPLLRNEAGGVYKYLSVVGQSNIYLDAVEANMEELGRRLNTEAI